jgi:hypothetical protein
LFGSLWQIKMKLRALGSLVGLANVSLFLFYFFYFGGAERQTRLDNPLAPAFLG